MLTLRRDIKMTRLHPWDKHRRKKKKIKQLNGGMAM